MKSKYLFLFAAALLFSFYSVKGQTVGEHLRSIAIKQYPDDKEMQDYVYEEQKTAYFYMIEKANDIECLHFAQKKYPDDYSMQKYVYEEQVEAKKFMRTVLGSAKSNAQKEYPDDYAMQKYKYENP
jgi:hypothetical protein